MAQSRGRDITYRFNLGRRVVEAKGNDAYEALRIYASKRHAQVKELMRALCDQQSCSSRSQIYQRFPRSARWYPVSTARVVAHYLAEDWIERDLRTGKDWAAIKKRHRINPNLPDSPLLLKSALSDILSGTKNPDQLLAIFYDYLERESADHNGQTNIVF